MSLSYVALKNVAPKDLPQRERCIVKIMLNLIYRESFGHPMSLYPRLDDDPQLQEILPEKLRGDYGTTRSLLSKLFKYCENNSFVEKVKGFYQLTEKGERFIRGPLWGFAYI